MLYSKKDNIFHVYTKLNASNAEATFVLSTRTHCFEDHLIPVMLVFIGQLLQSTLR